MNKVLFEELLLFNHRLLDEKYLLNLVNRTQVIVAGLLLKIYPMIDDEEQSDEIKRIIKQEFTSMISIKNYTLNRRYLGENLRQIIEE